VRRREFITLLGGAAAWPIAARAQQPAMPVIGYLSGRSPEAEARLREPFIKALETSGFVAGRNVAIEYRFAEGQDDRLPALAADLVRKRPAVLVAMDSGSAVAAKAATTTIPIVFGTGLDPVRLGLVETLNRPGGNATGVSVFVSELGPKRLQLLREIVPHATLIAYIVNLNTATGPAQKSEMESTAQAIGQQILVLSASTESEVNEAFATIAAGKADHYRCEYDVSCFGGKAAGATPRITFPTSHRGHSFECGQPRCRSPAARYQRSSNRTRTGVAFFLCEQRN
jgi:putative tryptophan/tyrosine transport system substrate-binding protein